MMTCTAKELCAATGGTLVQDGEGFSCVSTDSRRVEQGCLFIPLVGERFDGHTYLTQALESGAAGCLCSRLPEALVPGKFYVQVEDTLRAKGARRTNTLLLTVDASGKTTWIGKEETL